MNNSKKAKARQAKIRDMLQKQDVISIQEFCDILHVSVATIRNDLTYLEKNGFLKRVLGGAISTEGTPRNTNYASRINLYREEKRSIAKKIVTKYLKPNMKIIMDAGTTNYMIAEYLLKSDIPCEVITNAFNIAALLAKSKNIEVYLAGGKLDKDHNAFYDAATLSYIKQQKADVYLLSPNGIDLQTMITGSAKEENTIKKEFIANADKIIVVADHSKFNKTAKHFLLNFSRVTAIVSDDGLNKKQKEAYEKLTNVI